MCGNRNGKRDDDLMFRNGTIIDPKTVPIELSAIKTPLDYAEDWE